MTARAILLDTCAALWLVEGGLTASAETLVIDAWSERIAVFASSMTAWEVGMLVAKERLTLSMSVTSWFEALLALGVDLAELSPAILIASTELRAPSLRDPTDRIIAATARTHGYRLMTRDRPLLEFAASGQVTAIPC